MVVTTSFSAMGENNGAADTGMKNPKQGGCKATIFIYIMMGLDNIGFVANIASLVLYFLFVMQFDPSDAATTTTNFLGTTFLLTLVGALISDVYINRLSTCLIFGAIELMGYVLLIVQSHYQKLQPEACGETTCVHGTKALMFYGSLCLLGLGAGGIRGSVPALGADQFNCKDPKESKNLASFFNWFLLSTTVGGTIGVTVVVWVSIERGWDQGFIISLSCAFVGLIIIALGKPFYRDRIPGESPLLRILQVLVVAVRNRSVCLPENSDALYEIHDEESILDNECILHSDQFRFLDRAAILPEELKPKPWRVCTVTQVEEVKILIRMMPFILSTILMNTCLAQLHTFSIELGTMMNTHIGSFEVPSASIPVIPFVFVSILIPIYEFAFVPILRKITGHPSGITHLQRIGVGLVLSAISMGIAGIVELKRKNELLHHGNRINVFWLSFYYAIFGVADMFTLVGLFEFFYSEAPIGMRSLSTSFSWLSLSIGYFLSSAFVDLTNLVTSKFTKSKRGWLEGRDMNKNHVELFYWLLSILSLLNFANHIFWSEWYKYKNEVPTIKKEEIFKEELNHEEVKALKLSATSNNNECPNDDEKEKERENEGEGEGILSATSNDNGSPKDDEKEQEGEKEGKGILGTTSNKNGHPKDDEKEQEREKEGKGILGTTSNKNGHPKDDEKEQEREKEGKGILSTTSSENGGPKDDEKEQEREKEGKPILDVTSNQNGGPKDDDEKEREEEKGGKGNLRPTIS